jgi:hypothetical protein
VNYSRLVSASGGKAFYGVSRGNHNQVVRAVLTGTGYFETEIVYPATLDEESHKPLALSPNDSFLVFSRSGLIYRTQPQLQAWGNVPDTASGYAGFAFSAGSDTLFCAAPADKKIRAYAFPRLTLLREYPTRGWPEHVFLKDGGILCLARVAPDSPDFFAEKIAR